MYEYFDKTFSIRSSEVDVFGHCRPSVLMAFLQDVATDHSALMHVEREYLVEQYHAAWLLARAWFRLDRPLMQDDNLTVRTSHRGAGGLMVYRDFGLFVNGDPVGEAITAWVIADLESRKMLRPKNIENMAAADFPKVVKDKQLKNIRSPKEKTFAYDKVVRYSDLDINGHMNNTKYADAAMDALTKQELTGRYLREMQLNYSQECMPGETVKIYRAEMEDGTIYIDGVGENQDRRFEALFNFALDCTEPLDDSPVCE